jgi:hypothetical protein
MMHQQWFYGQEGHKLGPCTAQQLRELALAGKILLSDTIWKEGIDKGVLARRVKNLFPVPDLVPLRSDAAASAGQPVMLVPCPIQEYVPARAPETSPDQEAEVASTAQGNIPHKSPPPAYQPSGEKKPAKKGRALAIKGAKITGQDGISVQFRKMCTQCGHEDPSRMTIPIRTGMTRMVFYCRKCRKSRAVEIQGLC